MRIESGILAVPARARMLEHPTLPALAAAALLASCGGQSERHGALQGAFSGDTIGGPLVQVEVAPAICTFCGCALTRSGEIQCWGTRLPENIASLPLDGPYSQFSVGRVHACGLGVDGSVTCFSGHAVTSVSVPSLVGSYAHIAVGEMACGLDSLGALFCNSGASYSGVPVEGRFTDLSLSAQVIGAPTSVHMAAPSAKTVRSPVGTGR
jgi:hypothetical protein